MSYIYILVIIALAFTLFFSKINYGDQLEHMRNANSIKSTAKSDDLDSVIDNQRKQIEELTTEIQYLKSECASLKEQIANQTTPQGMKIKKLENIIAQYEAAIKRMTIQFESHKEKLKHDFNKEISWLAEENDTLMEENYNLAKINDKTNKNLEKEREFRLGLVEVAGSNLSALPYMARIIADYETIGIEKLAHFLDWGSNRQRLKKVKSIQAIRDDAQEIIERYKLAEYQLHYLLELYPSLQDVIECEYSELPNVAIDALVERDPVKNYISSEEYSTLSSREKNQLALDRYVESHTKTKWQIGRDYELYVGFQYEQRGGEVEYFGSNMGIEDLGRDLIVRKKDGTVLIVQCKYWGSEKLIHEKHVTQLFGTTISYCIENQISQDSVTGVLVTNIHLSPKAKEMAKYLGILFVEDYPMGTFPRIKCNNGKDENGNDTKIYHLPFDQQYDKIKMKHKNDCWAYTVEEAEKAGYRRAYKWTGA